MDRQHSKKPFWHELDDTATDESSQSDGESSKRSREMALYKARTCNREFDPRRTYNSILDSHLSEEVSHRNMEHIFSRRDTEPASCRTVYTARGPDINTVVFAGDTADRSGSQHIGQNNMSQKPYNENTKKLLEDKWHSPMAYVGRDGQDDRESGQYHSRSDSKGRTKTSGYSYEGGHCKDQQTSYSKWARSPGGDIHLRNYRLKEEWDEHKWKPESSPASEEFQNFCDNKQNPWQGAFSVKQDEHLNNHGIKSHSNEMGLYNREQEHRSTKRNCDIIDVSQFSDAVRYAFDSDEKINHRPDGANEFNAATEFGNSKYNFNRWKEIHEIKSNQQNINLSYTEPQEACFGNSNINMYKSSKDIDKAEIRHNTGQFSESYGMECLDLKNHEGPGCVSRQNFNLEQVENCIAQPQNRRPQNYKHPASLTNTGLSAINSEQYENSPYGNELFGNFQHSQGINIGTNQEYPTDFSVMGLNSTEDKYKYCENLTQGERANDVGTSQDDFFRKINARAEANKRAQQQHKRVLHKGKASESYHPAENLGCNISDYNNVSDFNKQCYNGNQIKNNSDHGNSSDENSVNSDVTDRFADLSAESDTEGEEYADRAQRIPFNETDLNYLERAVGGPTSAQNQKRSKKIHHYVPKLSKVKTNKPVESSVIDYCSMGNQYCQEKNPKCIQKKAFQNPKVIGGSNEPFMQYEFDEHYGSVLQGNKQMGNQEYLIDADELGNARKERKPKTKVNSGKNKIAVPLIADIDTTNREIPVLRIRLPEEKYFKIEQPPDFYSIDSSNHSNKDPCNDNPQDMNSPIAESFIERTMQYNECPKAEQTRKVRATVLGEKIEKQGSRVQNPCLRSNIGISEQKMADKPDLNVQENESDMAAFMEKQETLISCGKQVSNSLASSHLAKQLFLSMYDEWTLVRERTITLLKKLLENIQENDAWYPIFIREWKSDIQGMRFAMTEDAKIPPKEKSVFSKHWQSFWKSLVSNSDPPSPSFRISAQDVSKTLEEDANLLSEIEIYGLQCVFQFKETKKVMKNFWEIIITDQLFEDIEHEQFRGFLLAIAKLDPDDDAFCSDVASSYGALCGYSEVKDVPTIVDDTFCRFIKGDPSVLSTIRSINWNPRNGFDGTHRGWTKIQFVEAIGLGSRTHTIQLILETLMELTTEKRIFESDIEFLL